VSATATATRPLLTVRDLHVSYGRGPARVKLRQAQAHYAVRGVNIDIEPGQTRALVGESGSGKTTVGRAILGLVPASGTVEFRGQQILGAKGQRLRTARRGMQMIFQDPLASLDPRWPVERCVGEALPHLAGPERRARVLQLLESVGITGNICARLPRELSGGQRQRVAIARALATEPAFLVCDEPTSALDVTVGARIIDLLRELQQRTGVSYLFISHDLALVRSFADVVSVMCAGEIVETGTAEAIFAQPREDYTVRLLNASMEYGLDLTAHRDMP
jgi:peptide/nickel transport system ATP-binding protein